MNQKHTPMRVMNGTQHHYLIANGIYKAKTITGTEEDAEFASFVVRACNEHAALVEALKLLVSGCEQAMKNGLNQPQINGGMVLARAALSNLP